VTDAAGSRYDFLRRNCAIGELGVKMEVGKHCARLI
jgi:hypothetical protein